ncbi:MAG: RagB/SusD family nutrient uptake outer membrane protein [Parabacteroides sp.]|nr:RagB/SusD family nutrient uptake outer membrane protein [Parabacteroides sp.]
MKTYHKLIATSLLASSLLSFASCTDGLDIKPTSELESEFFESELRVQEGVGACYASLANMYGALLNDGGGIHEILLLPGDDVTHQDAGRGALEAFSGLNSSNGQVSTMWGRLYQTIYRCKFILEKIEEPEVQAVYTTNGLQDINKGEALFLRSWCYYRLWDLFRKAPLQDTRIHTISEAILPPSEGFQLLDKAIEDLELAATLLPDEDYWPLASERGVHSTKVHTDYL